MNATAKRPIVTVIPQKTPLNPMDMYNMTAIKLRVAGYARVSTDEEEQLNSYHAQVSYYTKKIQGNPEWAFVEVYTDEGLSATSTKKRDGFNRMIEEAMAGKIDLILTKSASRFARNTVDSLVTIRKLKEKGVGIFFEKENINTLDAKGELLITIMSSLAQEESRSISENVTWGKRKQFADGKVHFSYKNFLGYRRGEDGQPEIVPEEAEVVRLIYRLFLYGKTPSTIAGRLTEMGVPTPGGKANWRSNSVRAILENEKYKGDALLQKTYTADFLTKTIKKNNGEVQQYYVENSHAPIITPDIFDLVQHEIARRSAEGRMMNSDRLFSGQLICGRCGSVFGTKLWHSTSKYRRTVWVCGERLRGKEGCSMHHLHEKDIKEAYLIALHAVLENKAEIFSAYHEIINVLGDTSALDAERDAIQEECAVVMELVKKLVAENAQIAQDQLAYQARFETHNERYERLTERLHEIDAQRMEKLSKRTRMLMFVDTLMSNDAFATDFSEELWYTTVERVTVYEDRRLRFRFRDGTEYDVV